MKLLSRLVIALAICLMAIPMMATPVQAATGDFSISGGSISKDEGYVGDEVRIRGDASCSKVYIYYELFNESDEDEWYIGYISGDRDDVDPEYDYSDYIDIPESCMGEHEIRLCYPNDPDDDIDTLQFTVYPLIEIDEEEGPAGTEVEATGKGWDEKESEIEIRFYLEDPDDDYDDDDLYEVVWSGDIEVDDYGTWEDVTFEVPPSKKGTHWIYAVGDKADDIEDDEIKGVEFEVSPGISLDTEKGSLGDTVTVTGSGFEEDEGDIEILFDGDVVAEDIEADEDGIWEETFEVPEAAMGKYDVTAQGEDTDEEDIEEVEFEVEPGLVLSPTEGHMGTTLSVSGGGFPKNKPVTITYDGVTQGSKTTDSKGSFSGISFEAKGMHGKQTIKATYDSATLSAEFTMESKAPPAPTLTSPATGERVGFMGRKFTPTFTWSAVTDESGVSYNLQIGTSAAFAQVIVSKTGLSEASYTLTEEEALPYGSYYWRVKTIDGAQNDSGWSVPYSFKSGILPFWAFIAIAALLAVLIGVLVYLFAFRRRAGYE